MRKYFKLTPTTLLIIVNLTIYILTSILGGNLFETNQEILIQFGQFNLNVINGNYLQLFSSIFVHVDLTHITLNMIFLVIFGLRAEELFKTQEYFAAYIFSGLLGSIMTLFLMSPYTLSAGASGAIFGIYGATIMYTRKTFGQSIAGALLYSFLFLMLTAGSNVNIIAHFGGLVGGLLIGYILAKSRPELYWLETFD